MKISLPFLRVSLALLLISQTALPGFARFAKVQVSAGNTAAVGSVGGAAAGRSFASVLGNVEPGLFVAAFRREISVADTVLSGVSGRTESAQVDADAEVLAGRVLADPEVLADPQVREYLNGAIGVQGLAQADTLARRLKLAAERRPEVKRWLARRTGEADNKVLTREKVSGAISKLKGAASSWRSKDEDAAVEGEVSKKPGGLRRAMAAVVMAGMTMAATLPALAQSADVLSLQRHEPIVLAQAQQTSRVAAYERARNYEDVIAKWSKNTRLYVVGDVGLDSAAMGRLASYLKDKHWTIVLMQDASGNRYTDAEGRTHYDLDAVDFGNGQGIPHRGGFSDQVNAKTGEADGVVLTIVLAQRKYYYAASRAQDSRGIGEADFMGKNLNRWLVSNLRNGGDVVGAVKDTVVNLDALLSEAIDSEFSSAGKNIELAKSRLSELKTKAGQFSRAHPEAAKTVAAFNFENLGSKIVKAETAYKGKQAAEAVRWVSSVLNALDGDLAAIASFEESFRNASAELEKASADVARLDAAARGFRSEYPKVRGTLANPAVGAMTERLAGAQKTQGVSPQEAVAVAHAVRAEAAAAAEAITVYPSGEKILSNAEARLREVLSDEFAQAASEESVQAKQKISEAREGYETGAPNYLESIRSAKSALDLAEAIVADAGAAARRNRMIVWGLTALGTLGLGLAGIFLNIAARRWRKRSLEQLARWRTALDDKLEIQLDDLDQRVDIWLGAAHDEEAVRYEGKTKNLAVAARADVGTLSILWDIARDTLDRAEDLVNPKGPAAVGNWFFPGKYKEALDLLDEENGAKVTFDPSDEETLRRIFGEKINRRERLYGKISAFAQFEKSLGELLSEYNERAQRADGILSQIQTAVETSRPIMDAISASISQTSARNAAIQHAGAEDGLFLLPSLAAALLPAAQAALTRTRENVTKDPIGALETSGAQARRLADEAQSLADLVLDARKNAFPKIDGAVAAMKSVDIAVEWVDAELGRYSGRGESLASQAIKTAAAERIVKLASDMNLFAVKTERAAELSKALFAARDEKISKITDVVAEARSEIGRALGLSTAKILHEKGSDPTVYLKNASEKADAMAKYLGVGEIEGAESAYAELSQMSAGASEIVKASREALAAHETTVAERRAETSRLEALVAEHESILSEIERSYAQSVLALAAGDASHPNANGTVKDNIVEIGEDLSAANEKLTKALSAHRSGSVLEGANLLGQIAAHQEEVRLRMQEIRDKQARLAAAVSANAQKLVQLDLRTRDYGATIRTDRRYMKPTLEDLKAAEVLLAEARDAVEARKGDPFIAGEKLRYLEEGLEALHVKMNNDLDIYAEAERSLAEASRQIGTAVSWAKKADGDGIADSQEIESAYQTLRELRDALNRAEESLTVERGNWNRVDEAADNVTAAAARVTAALKREIAEGEAAVTRVSRAAHKVREAGGWTGSYGVSIPGSPGSSELRSARSALDRGQYADAQSYAERAYRLAESAIADAESEVRRRRREEEERRRREEEARRRRQREEEARRRRSSGGSGGSGSGGGSWGGSSSGSASGGW